MLVSRSATCTRSLQNPRILVLASQITRLTEGMISKMFQSQFNKSWIVEETCRDLSTSPYSSQLLLYSGGRGSFSHDLLVVDQRSPRSREVQSFSVRPQKNSRDPIRSQCDHTGTNMSFPARILASLFPGMLGITSPELKARIAVLLSK